MKNIFDSEVTQDVINRIHNIKSDTQPKWGKMDAAQMFAHCCVTYEYIYDEGKYPKPKGIKKLFLKLFVKNMVVGEKPYPKNSRTAPDFLVTEQKVFDTEKNRLIDFLTKTQALGENHFNNKESHSFGPLKISEWNNMFYKHINHHLEQFGV